MSIEHVILGFLTEGPATGYDIKKRFAGSHILHWSGNSNQIYRALVALHEAGFVTIEVTYQENKPPRKVYTMTEAGRTELRQWLLQTPELPHLRHPLIAQLMWVDQLAPDELDAMLARYADELRDYMLELRERDRRQSHGEPARNSGAHLREEISAHWTSFYERELEWVEALRRQLSQR